MNRLYIDIRSLLLFRHLLSLLLIYDIIDRISDFQAHYTDYGVLPSEILKSDLSRNWAWCQLINSDSSLLVSLIFISLILAAVVLLLGIKTKWSLVVCWIGLSLIQERNPIIYQGGDDLLRLITFWSMFLPLSNNEFFGQYRIKRFQYSSVVTFIISCQVLFPFFFSALFKNPTEWWHEGSSVYYALNLDQITRPLGLWFSKHYNLSIVLTRIVYLIELLVLPLFILSLFFEKIRILIFILLVSLNIGIAATMMIGIFPLCFLVSSVLFLPSSVWDKLGKMKMKAFKSPFTNMTLAKKKTKQRPYPHWIMQSLAGFLFIIVVLWNVAILPNSSLRFPNGFHSLVQLFNLHQSWGMFAPTVLKEDGWLVFEAQLNDNSIIDINSENGKNSYTKPANLLNRLKNDRWRKYSEQIVLSSNGHLRKYYCIFLINRWNYRQKNESRKIKRLKLVWVKETTLPYPQEAAISYIELIDFDASSIIAMRDSHNAESAVTEK